MADRARLADLLGQPVAAVTPLHGGDLSEVCEICLADGTALVVKTGPLVAAEARMLTAIARTGAPAPGVIAQSGDLLVMERLVETRPHPAGWAALGAALKALHASTGTAYGWAEDYAFGPAAIPNAPLQNWPAFWAERRLLAWPQALPRDIARRLEALATRLPDLLPHHPAPALLHGDLWTGNVLFTANGAALIDPACYHGDAEVDLAMLHLFGKPGPGFADTYGALAPGWQDRRAIYTLWPALVHLRLFGSGYRGMVENCLSQVKA
ncbi:fructosamine kinase family protein [Rhodovulum adriaticum]|uniref:Fructosamine-3-kinase n=1 Tax=Rhodovulum adriaticum TaxID=35804 RepID=A0A4R2NJ74_RHOAD|nr:fructosamine kinase family protein [Rhodovulum adriaticum]MBK1634646.1 aminoglycoside phosphotransferase [Rhodovulum adriaticum]TCP21275.1 fructosamine-3-kinase [Rhodovulum adriaticum]